jgi:hypothetical protein
LLLLIICLLLPLLTYSVHVTDVIVSCCFCLSGCPCAKMDCILLLLSKYLPLSLSCSYCYCPVTAFLSPDIFCLRLCFCAVNYVLSRAVALPLLLSYIWCPLFYRIFLPVSVLLSNLLCSIYFSSYLYSVCCLMSAVAALSISPSVFSLSLSRSLYPCVFLICHLLLYPSLSLSLSPSGFMLSPAAAYLCSCPSPAAAVSVPVHIL